MNVNGRQAPNWQWQQLIVLTGSRNEDEWINDLPTAAHKQRYQRTTNSWVYPLPAAPLSLLPALAPLTPLSTLFPPFFIGADDFFCSESHAIGG